MTPEFPEKESHTLVYPKHQFKPEDLLTFVELGDFTKNWEKLRLNDEEDLAALQIMIMLNPRKAPVVEGTGGLRKMRFAPDSWNTGKSGATRICYVYFEDFGLVLLVTAYGKNEKDTLSKRERSDIKKYLLETKHYLENDHFS